MLSYNEFKLDKFFSTFYKEEDNKMKEILDIIRESVCSTGERIGERARGKRIAIFTHLNEGNMNTRLYAIIDGFMNNGYNVDTKDKISEFEYEIKIRANQDGKEWTIFIFERKGFVAVKIDQK